MSHSVTRERTAPKNMDQLYEVSDGCSDLQLAGISDVGPSLSTAIARVLEPAGGASEEVDSNDGGEAEHRYAPHLPQAPVSAASAAAERRHSADETAPRAQPADDQLAQLMAMCSDEVPAGSLGPVWDAYAAARVASAHSAARQSSAAGASVSTAGASAVSAGHGAEWHLLSQPEVETGPMARLRQVLSALVPGENALAELRGVTAP